MPSVLLIDDDTELTGLLSEYLADEGFSVTTVPDGTTALLDIVRTGAQIVVLDIMMPRINGIEVLRRIRRESSIPVLMLTARGDDVDRIAGLDLGADDYLAKPCSPGELAARLRAILRRVKPGEAVEDPLRGLHRLGPLSLDSRRRIAAWNSTPIRLTGAEFNILEVLVEGFGSPVSREELSLRGLGRPLSPYDRALDVHISAIRQKLGSLGDGRSPIVNVRGVGYQFVSG